jgi:membrane-associated phospholipid phosphatase
MKQGRRVLGADAAFALCLIPPLSAVILLLATHGNVPVFRALQQAARIVPGHWYAPFWESVTLLGATLGAFALGSLFIAGHRTAAWAGIVAAVPASAFTHLLKALVPMPRPAVVLDSVTVAGPLLQVGSFPSGHSVTIAALAGVIFLAYPSVRVRCAVLLVAGFVALSRAAVGAHWPLDIAAGLAAGWISAWIGWWIVERWRWTQGAGAGAVAALVFGACSVVLFFYDTRLYEAKALRMALATVGVLASARALAAALRERRAGRIAPLTR